MLRSQSMLLLLIACTQISYAQQVFKCTDTSGTITYSDQACSDNPEVIDIPKPNSVPDFRSSQRVETSPYQDRLPAPDAIHDSNGSSCWEDLEFSVIRAQDSFIRLSRETDFERARRLAKNLSYDLEDLSFQAMNCECILASGDFDQASWDLRKASRAEESVEDFVRYLKRAASSFDGALMMLRSC